MLTVFGAGLLAASLVWVPIGVRTGMNPRGSGLARFPATLPAPLRRRALPGELFSFGAVTCELVLEE